MYPVNREAISASKLGPFIPYTSSTSVPAATAGPSPTSSSTSVSVSRQQSQLQPPRWCQHLPVLQETSLPYQCLPQLPVRSSHVTAARVPSHLSSCMWCLISLVTYRGRMLQRRRTARGYYGEALTRDDVIQHMEEEEQQKREKKANKGRKRDKTPNSSSAERSQCRCWK